MPKDRRGGKQRNRLPHYKQAIIPQEKIGNYLLNPENEKARGKPIFFRKLGYNMKNSSRMISDIKDELGKNKAKQYESDAYGRTNYEVVVQLGLTQKSSVLTVWAIDKGKNTPRFITAVPYRKRGKTNDK